MLDTNVVRRGKLIARARQQRYRMSISSIVFAERLAQVRREHDDLAGALQFFKGLLARCQIEVVEFPEADGHSYAELAHAIGEASWQDDIEKRRRLDRLIAACALSRDLPIVTFNRRHFEGIERLSVIDGKDFAAVLGVAV